MTNVAIKIHPPMTIVNEGPTMANKIPANIGPIHRQRSEARLIAQEIFPSLV